MGEYDLYYITDGDKYISSTLSIVSQLSKAGIWTESKADNVLSNMKNNISRLSEWKKVKMCDDADKIKDTLDKAESDGKLRFINIDDFNKNLIDMATIAHNLSEYDKGLDLQYKIVELELCDIYHYIEFSNLDLFRSWKALNLLKDTLSRRRQIKDEQILINNLRGLNILDCNLSRVEGSIKGLEERKYRPRVIESLFV